MLDRGQGEPAPPGPPPAQPLFRRQALAAARPSGLGTVLLAAPVSQSLFVAFAIAALAGVAALGYFGSSPARPG